MAENFNPYGSAISRSSLYVYDPSKLSSQFIDKGLEKQEKIFGEIVATRKKEVQYANDILNNLGALKDQAELEHNNFINARVDTLIEQVKGNMTKKGKLGLVSFNFNNPEFQLQLRQGVNQIKRGINNSKLLKDQYDDFVKFLNINKDVVSNQVDLLNRASQNVTNPVNIFTANDPTIAFTNLKDEAIDERKFISQTARGILDQESKISMKYQATTKDGQKYNVFGRFSNIYERDENGLIKTDSNGKPQLNADAVQKLKDEVKNTTTITKVTNWLNDPKNNDEFIKMITSDLDIAIQTELDRLKIENEKKKSDLYDKQLNEENITNKFQITKSDNFKIYDVEGNELSSDNTVRYVNIPEGDYLKDQTLGGIPIPNVIGIGYHKGKKALVIKRGDDKVVVTAGSNYADAFDTDVLEDLSGKDLVVSEQSMNETWDQVDTEAKSNAFRGNDIDIYNETLSNAEILSKNDIKGFNVDDSANEIDALNQTQTFTKEELENQKQQLISLKEDQGFLKESDLKRLKEINEKLQNIEDDSKNEIINDERIKEVEEIIEKFNEAKESGDLNQADYDSRLQGALSLLDSRKTKQNDATVKKIDELIEDFKKDNQ